LVLLQSVEATRRDNVDGSSRQVTLHVVVNPQENTRDGLPASSARLPSRPSRERNLACAKVVLSPQFNAGDTLAEAWL
jgi:hypothetical protein